MTNVTLWFIIGGTIILLLGLSVISLLLSDDSLAMIRIRLLRYYRVGDLVTLGPNLQGRVTAINLFTTTLLTAEQDRVIISNRAVLNSAMITHATHALTTPSPTDRASVNGSAEDDNSPSSQPLNRPTITDSVINSPLIESPNMNRPVERAAEMVATNPLAGNVADDKVPPPPAAPTLDLPTAPLAADTIPSDESRAQRAALPLSWASHKPLGKRPRLGTKSVGALSFGMIPVMRRDKVVVNLPIEQPQATNDQAKPSNSRQWRFGPTAWRARSANRK